MAQSYHVNIINGIRSNVLPITFDPDFRRSLSPIDELDEEKSIKISKKFASTLFEHFINYIIGIGM